MYRKQYIHWQINLPLPARRSQKLLPLPWLLALRSLQVVLRLPVPVAKIRQRAKGRGRPRWRRKQSPKSGPYLLPSVEFLAFVWGFGDQHCKFSDQVCHGWRQKNQWRESPRPVLLTKKVTATRMKIECEPNPGAVLRHLKPVILRTDWIIETLRFHRSKTKKALKNADGQHTRLI